MKRFFQPIQKEGSFKKPTLSPPDTTDNTQASSNDDKNNQDPLKFLTWNANSFLLRVKNNWPEFTKFVQTFDPDVIAIQEVRMPAAGSKGAPKNPGELKDDTNASREEKQCRGQNPLSIRKTTFVRLKAWEQTVAFLKRNIMDFYYLI